MSSPNANAIGEVASKFNKLYIMPPNRLTRIKKTMNIMFGRTGDEQRVPINFLARTAERNPRREDMNCAQDWPSVWPAAQPFRSSAVPRGMGSYGNLELLKIPNFLHLTPLHVQRHSQAIKKFCTKFPEELKKASTKEQYTPVRLVYSDYIHQSTNIRDIRAREVTAHIRLNSFELKDTHAHNKCRQLLGDRYNEETDTFNIKSDRCPLRRQNIDYLSYVLTALFHESHRIEKWETSMVQELLALKEQERLDAEGEPESDRQAQLMMDRN
uniref:Ribosomal protein S24/S35 mitochondrial conserved domain-containing protein n=1 Tax=Globodera rostochiensis TaxID=31243 RepID=A0A914HW57_GLORO